MPLYVPQNVCSRGIEFELSEDNTVHNVRFIRGCIGNALGIAALVEGQQAKDVIQRLRGIRCGNKTTSCPDQLACALEEELSEHMY